MPTIDSYSLVFREAGPGRPAAEWECAVYYHYWHCYLKHRESDVVIVTAPSIPQALWRALWGWRERKLTLKIIFNSYLRRHGGHWE